jgi:hypothetical protein
MILKLKKKKKRVCFLLNNEEKEIVFFIIMIHKGLYHAFFADQFLRIHIFFTVILI